MVEGQGDNKARALGKNRRQFQMARIPQENERQLLVRGSFS